jgi:hypothetical protein
MTAKATQCVMPLNKMAGKMMVKVARNVAGIDEEDDGDDDGEWGTKGYVCCFVGWLFVCRLVCYDARDDNDEGDTNDNGEDGSTFCWDAG